MKSTTVYLVELSEPLREMAMLAAREAFPRTQLQLVPVRTVAEAARLPGQGRQLLVIGEASEGEIGTASQAVDHHELPRWAVVHVGRIPSDVVETVSPDRCTAPMLARILRSAVLHQELLRDNLQLRGDLKTLARRLSHDIRTPLGCINTICTLLQESPGGSRAAHESVGTIRGATSEIDALLDHVGVVIKASSEPLPTGTVALGPVVATTLRQLADRELRGVKVAEPAHWPEVRGVEPWLAFIWFHLVQQAVRHTGHGRSLQLGWENRGADIRCWVATESGVPPSLQANLFRPFHLLHQQASASLELSLVDRLVGLQGGRFGYESSPERRGLFHFTVPAAGHPGSAPAARESSASGRAP